MRLRRQHSFSAWGVLPFLTVACLLVGCVPPPEPQAETPEKEVHKKSRHHHEGEEGADSPRRHEGKRDESPRSEEARGAAPENVLTVLKYVEEHHEAPAGYEGGREFHNSGGRGDEQALPRRDDRGRPISYQEWDVNRKVPGVNRGAERLITGSDGSAYYTSDHYRTFTKIR
jgi:ribonuclease T1